jgi:Plavaka transposase
MRRATRVRRVPARFGKSGDLLPSAQMAAMTIYSQALTPDPSPTPSQSSPTISRSPSPMPVDIPSTKPMFHETIPNQFGLYRRYTTWPSFDPEDDITIDDLIDAPSFINTTDRGYRKSEDAPGSIDASSNPFSPYLNATVYRLMNWFYHTGSKTLNTLNDLVHDVILAPDFDTNHLQNFSASSEAKRLDDNPMFPASDGWHETSVKIRLPKTRAKYANEDDAPEAEIPRVLHRDLLQSIITAFKDPSFGAFHLKGFTQFWKPSPDEPAEEIYGEAYASEMFREMEREVQSMKPPGETFESVVVPIMAYSDSTHLANFGTAALWPIYFFIGLTSKYIRAKPTSFSAHHLAYIPSVSMIFFYLDWY